MAEINAEIAALQERLKRVAAEFAASYEPLRAAARAAVDGKIAAGRVLDRRLDAQFPDLVGHARSSAACWTAPTMETSP
jgi:hypothetical protein